MKYLLIVIILGISAAAYCLHEQDQAQIVTLQQQVRDLSANANPANVHPTLAYPTADTTPPPAAPVPGGTAIDTARSAAENAAKGYDLGQITTTDGQVYNHCKLLKQEQDGVTLSHDDGIIKIPYWKMTPAEQKTFGYDIQKATAAAEAEAQQAAVSPATPTPGNP